jgi:hypothetical protein
MVCGLAFLGLTGPLRGADLEGAPIHYLTAPTHNAITRLEERLAAGKATLVPEDHFGYLRGLLRELGVPESSQTLVFSKTSLQNHRIGPRTPRALYFNDEVYVGFCQKGDVIEVTAADPNLGAVFYTLDQKADKPKFTRQGDTCLICHGSSHNQGFPGTIIRSVYSDPEGYGILASGTYRVDHTTPLAQRWGGWYVTGTSGKQTHLGNLIVRGRNPRPEDVDNTAGTNVTDLSTRFETSRYLTPHSDLVALLVVEHQAETFNRLTRANLQTRLALHEAAELNKALGRPADFRSDSFERRLKSAGEPLVKHLLMSGEIKLTEKVAGTSSFAREFASRGPRDNRGRSLRELDLQRRLFRYPCSYLIYSAAFDGLPTPMKDYVYRRLWDVLTGKDHSEEFSHLSAEDRQAIREILIATKSDLPDYWKGTKAE